MEAAVDTEAEEVGTEEDTATAVTAGVTVAAIVVGMAVDTVMVDMEATVWVDMATVGMVDMD